MIEWGSFVAVFLASLVSACVGVVLFSLGLRLADGEARWRRPVSVLMFALCGLAVLFGLYVIVGDHLITIFTR